MSLSSVQDKCRCVDTFSMHGEETPTSTSYHIQQGLMQSDGDADAGVLKVQQRPEIDPIFAPTYMQIINMHKLFLHPPRPNLSCQCNAREQMNIQGLLLARPRTALHCTAPAASSVLRRSVGVVVHARMNASASIGIALVLFAPTNNPS